jgi:hypothetical protein
MLHHDGRQVGKASGLACLAAGGAEVTAETKAARALRVERRKDNADAEASQSLGCNQHMSIGVPRTRNLQLARVIGKYSCSNINV